MITPSIWEFGPKSLIALTAAYAVIEPISYYLIPAISKSATVKEYYNHKRVPFPIVASGDYLYSVVLFLVAQQVIGAVFGSGVAPNIGGWLLRFLTFCGVQWSGDFTWYQIVSRLPRSTKYIDFFQRYMKEVSGWAIIGDSLYGLSWFSVAQVIASYVPMWLQIAAIVMFLFLTIVVSW